MSSPKINARVRREEAGRRRFNGDCPLPKTMLVSHQHQGDKKYNKITNLLTRCDTQFTFCNWFLALLALGPTGCGILEVVGRAFDCVHGDAVGWMKWVMIGAPPLLYSLMWVCFSGRGRGVLQCCVASWAWNKRRPKNTFAVRNFCAGCIVYQSNEQVHVDWIALSFIKHTPFTIFFCNQNIHTFIFQQSTKRSSFCSAENSNNKKG